MADESNESISSRRSSVWLKEITSNGFAKLLAFEKSRTGPRAGRDVYKRLRKDEFRVLHIEHHDQLNGATSKRYSCRLSTHKLSSFPNEDGYAAVSYTWKSHAQRWKFGLDHASVQVQGQAFSAASRVAPMLATLFDVFCLIQLRRLQLTALLRAGFETSG